MAHTTGDKITRLLLKLEREEQIEDEQYLEALLSDLILLQQPSQIKDTSE